MFCEERNYLSYSPKYNLGAFRMPGIHSDEQVFAEGMNHYMENDCLYPHKAWALTVMRPVGNCLKEEFKSRR